jgi:hypothetical protein
VAGASPMLAPQALQVHRPMDDSTDLVVEWTRRTAAGNVGGMPVA